jgi:hypothetical protein
MSDTKAAEPVHWRAVLAEEQRPQKSNGATHVVGFRDRRSAESWIASELDFGGWTYTLEPLYAAPQPQAAPPAVERDALQDWPLIALGFGKVEVGEGRHDGVRALIFGRNGTGEIGAATQPNRMHLPGETLAVITFTNVECVDVVVDKLRLIRAALANQAPGEPT